jgi:ABC-type transporter Mla subunit MlaD
MMDLVGRDITSRTAAFQALGQKVSDIDTTLEALSNEINTLVARVSAVNQVIADITQVVSLTKTFFV